MTDIITRVLITDKESEALMWGLAQIGDHLDRRPTDPSDPLRIALDAGYSRKAIALTCAGLFAQVYTDWLTGPFGDLDKLLLRLCVENTTWVTTYRTTEPTRSSPPLISEAMEALRTLSKKLEAFDIEVNHIPAN